MTKLALSLLLTLTAATTAHAQLFVSVATGVGGTGDGPVQVPADGGYGAFAVAAMVGPTIVPAMSVLVPPGALICRTDPATAVCITPLSRSAPGPASASGSISTYSVFVTRDALAAYSAPQPPNCPGCGPILGAVPVWFYRFSLQKAIAVPAELVDP